MSISLPGMIGALIGFALAWVDWKAVSGILRHKHQQKAFAMTGAEERRRADARLRVLLKVVFVLFFIGFPVIGYLTGAQIAG